MTFNESNIRRDRGGKFSEKRGSASNITLRAEEKTYHRDIGLPSNVTVPQRKVKCEHTGHSDRERWGDRYGVIPKVEEVDLTTADVVEVTTANNRISKLLVRVPHPEDETLDVVMAIRPGEDKRDPWRVVTNWLNKRNDTHQTLDRSKYATV